MANILKKIAFRFLLIVLFTGGPLSVGHAQEFDLGTAWGIEFSKKINSNFDVGLSQEFRFNEQSSNLNRSATQLSIEYGFLRKICKAGIFGTFIRKENGLSRFYSEYRMGTELSAKADYKSFNFSWRTRMLSTWRDEVTGSYNVNPKLSLRNRFQLEHKLFSWPLKPYISCEPFIFLNALGGPYINNLRYCFGTSYRMNKRSSWDAGLRFDQEVQVVKPSRFFSLDVAYKYKF